MYCSKILSQHKKLNSLQLSCPSTKLKSCQRLSLGASFALTPTDSYAATAAAESSRFAGDFARSERNLVLADFFAQSSIGWSDDNCPPVFRLPSSGWDPRTDPRYKFAPDPGSTEYLKRVRDGFLQKFRQPPAPTHNLKRRQLDALIELQRRHDIVMVETDKNLGIAVDDRSSYINNCLTQLQTTHDKTNLSPAAAAERIVHRWSACTDACTINRPLITMYD